MSMKVTLLNAALPQFPTPAGSCYISPTSPWAVVWRCLRDVVFSRFDTLPARVPDGQTDGRTHVDG